MFAGQFKWVKSCLAGMLLLTAYLTTLILPLTAAVLPQVDDNNAPAFGANTNTFELAKDTPGNSTAVSVGSAPAFDSDVTDTLTYSLEPLVYMLGNELDALYTLNTDTGVASKVITTTTTEFGVDEDMPTGLVWHKNRLYMVGAGYRRPIYGGPRHWGRHTSRHPSPVRHRGRRALGSGF